METKETLDLLKKMQASLQRVQHLETELDQNPKRILALEADTAEKNRQVDSAEEALKAEKVNHSTLENDVKTLQDQLSSKNLQTLEVKTNEQLWALQKEIKFIKQKISDKELGIIQSMEDIEEKTDQLNEAKKEFADHKKENDAEISKLKGEVEGLRQELEIARKEHAEIAEQIPPRYANLLERIQKNKGGSAMAEVVDSSCSICHFRIRPQAFMEVKMGKAIHQCPNCSRILYHVEPETGEEQ